jgi:hypothetical protein
VAEVGRVGTRRELNAKGRRSRSGLRYQSEPQASCDESGVAGRRDRQRQRGERLRHFGRANIELVQSLLV